ncbi:MAG: VCBS repeat-containing protein, partial [Planctomycetota bacterium JB042]
MAPLTTALGLALALAVVGDGEEGMLRIAPLAKRSPAVGATLFETVPAAASGVDFRHRFDPRTSDEVFELASVHAGGGVAIGDVDGDGRPEVVLTRPTGGARLYRNLGGFAFEDASAAAGIGDETWPLGPSLADLDGDGALDLHVGQRGAPSRLYRNLGDGRFEERAAAFGLGEATDAVMMAFADVDLDGDLDGYLLTYGRTLGAERTTLVRPDGSTQEVPAGLPDHLFRNERREDGAVALVDVSAASGIGGDEWGLSAIWFDPDDDGDPDLYVANDFFGADHLYVNRGDGTFEDRAADALPHTPWFSMGAAAGDVDGDGRDDLLATDMAATTHVGEKEQMGDMARNSWFLEAPTPRQVMRNALYVNTGTSRFQEAAFLAGVARSDWTWSPKLADLDVDGRLDLFVANGHTGDWFHGDLQVVLAAALVARKAIELPTKRDVNLAFRNAGDLRFEPAGDAWGLARAAVSFGAAVGDLDGDGDPDLVVNDYDAPVALHRNHAAGARAVVRLVGGPGGDGRGARVRVVAAGREQVRRQHPESGCMAADEPVVRFGLGDAERISLLEVRWPGGATQRFEDLPVDAAFTLTAPAEASRAAGEPDPEAPESGAAPLFVARPEGAPVPPEREFDEFAVQPLLPFRLSRLGPGLAVGDVDGDGVDERYRSAPAGAAGAIERRGEDGAWTRGDDGVFAADAECEDAAPLFLDADGDGDLDLFVASGGVERPAGDPTYRDRIYRNDGEGSFGEAPADALPDRRLSSSAAVAFDVEGDGDLDLFVGARVVPGRYPEAAPSVLLQNESRGGALRFE